MSKSKLGKSYAGINIQFPISQLILSGKKSIETRTYPIPKKYVGKAMLMIETPGKKGGFKSRIVAIIKFDNCFEYKNSKEFYKDKKKHFVAEDSLWAWNDKKPKWGWSVQILKRFKKALPMNKPSGIKFTTNIAI